MKKNNKIYYACCLMLIFILCFSNVVFADNSSLPQGIGVKSVLQEVKDDSKGVEYKEAQIEISGVKYDEHNGRNYYEYDDNGETKRQYIEGTIKCNGTETYLEAFCNPDYPDVCYVIIPNPPEGEVTEEYIKSCVFGLNGGPEIDLANQDFEVPDAILPVERESFLDAVSTKIRDELIKLVEDIFNGIMLPLGDGVLFMLYKAVGEPVTIDSIIFNDIEKVDVNYWEKASPSSVKEIMSKVISYWYSIFRKVACVVYLITLAAIGVTIMFNSTADKKARYKDALVSWVVGVAILFLFPYVMKYMVELNNAVVGLLRGNFANSNTVNTSDAIANIKGVSLIDGFKYFGKDGFVELMLGDGCVENGKVNSDLIGDSMMKTRAIAQNTHQFVITIIYLILIGETIVLLFMYYKRAFMVAFLITIFPIVVMSYAIDKLGDRKAQSFGIWFKEFTVNVIVQMFHAVIYVLIVNTTIELYSTKGGSDWLLMILSVLFLFEGEKILRNIFSIKSSAGTIGDLAATGIAVTAVAKKAQDMIKGSGKGAIDPSKDDADAQKAIESRNSNSSNLAAENAKTEMATPSTGIGLAASTEQTASGESGSSAETANVPTSSYNEQNARDTVANRILDMKKKKGMLSRGTTTVGRVLGATMGATYGLSKGQGLATAFAEGTKGKSIGGLATQPLSAIASKIDNRINGGKVAEDIANGKYDQELRLNEAARLSVSEIEAAKAEAHKKELPEEDIIAQYGSKKQEVMREALARYAKKSANGSEYRAQLQYQKYMDKHRVDKK